MPLVSLRNVSFRYAGDEAYAIQNVSLEADRGELILLTGPSGCGKSTLLRVINGLIPHFYEGEFSGEALVHGLSVSETPPYKLARYVGTVFQDPENQLFLSSVEREIAFGLENLGFSRREIRERVEETLRRFGLEAIRDRAPFELSGGQQQKVAIATVMAMEPSVLLMDEPTANLDPLSAFEILAMVAKLVREKSILAIVVEHRLEIALYFASRMTVMKEGRILVDDRPEKALSRAGDITGLPPVYSLYQILREQGLSLSKPPLTPEEFAEEYVRVVQL